MPLRDAPQSHVCVVLERLGYRSIRLRERAIAAPAAPRRAAWPARRTRNAWASSPSGNEPASQLAQTTPPALAENAPRCSASPHAAHEAELRHEAGGQQQLQPERQRLRAAGGVRARVEQRELVAEQVVGGRLGSAESSSRSTASQAWVARSSEARALAQRGVRVHRVGRA